jgi:spore coat protein CotH
MMQPPSPETTCVAVALPLAVAALLLLATGCEPDNWKDPVFADALADTDVGEFDSGRVGGRTDAKDVQDGPGKCAEHVLQCAPGQGCHDGVCGQCLKGSECRALEGCNNAKCGLCKLDEDCKSGKACINGFCLRKTVLRWDLQIDDTQWASINSKPGEKKYIPCKLKVGAELFEPCTVRVRGGITKYYPKRGYRIRFDQDATHPGYSRKINLRAEYNDPTFMRNYVASWLFDQLTDIPTPRVRYRRLFVNGKDYGLYAEVERIGEKFRRKRGRDPKAPLYEADPPSSIEGKGAGSLQKLPADVYKSAYQKHSDPENDYKDLIEFIEKRVMKDHIEGTSTNVRAHVATGWYLDYLAVQAAVMGADHVRKNYYLSLQKGSGGAKRWEIYPWDLDMTFGCVWQGGADKNLCTKLSGSIGIDVGVLPDGVGASYGKDGVFCGVLIDTVLRAPDLRKQFEQRICKILASKIWNERMPKLIDALETYLMPEVLTDKLDLNTSTKQFRDEVANLRKWIEQRNAVLKFDLDCT